MLLASTIVAPVWPYSPQERNYETIWNARGCRPVVGNMPGSYFKSVHLQRFTLMLAQHPIHYALSPSLVAPPAVSTTCVSALTRRLHKTYI